MLDVSLNMKTVVILCSIFLISLFSASAHWVEPIILSVSKNGKTSDKNILVEIWDNDGAIGYEDYRTVLVAVTKEYLTGGRIYFTQDKKMRMNMAVLLRESEYTHKGKEFFSVHVHKDSIKDLSFTLYKKTDNEYEPSLVIEGSTILKGIKTLKKPGG